MQPLTVLLTNNALGQRGGSETYVRDVALALLRRGHKPLAFSLEHGEVAAELRQATIPVIDDLERLGAAPDVIHGHHHLETFMAALALPGVPIVQFCHGWLPWEELPLRHPSVRRYVAVDEVCRDRLLLEEGIAPHQVDVVLNFVDGARFRPRSPLPPRPSRALVFSNSAGRDGYVRAIRSACDGAGIHLDMMGLGSGAATSTPEVVLRDYDLVFAKARSALEALVVGCAVVLADRAGCGPLVTSANYDRLRPRNFGIRELGHPHEPGWCADQIARFDAADAAAVSASARADADLERAVDRLTDIYMHAIAAPGEGDPAPSTAAYRHLRRISMAFKQAHAISVQLDHTRGELQAARGDRDRQQALAEERLRELLLSRRQNWSRLPRAALRRLRAAGAGRSARPLPGSRSATRSRRPRRTAPAAGREPRERSLLRTGSSRCGSCRHRSAGRCRRR